MDGSSSYVLVPTEYDVSRLFAVDCLLNAE